MERHLRQLQYIVKHGGAEFAEPVLGIINDFYRTVKQRRGARGRWANVVLLPVPPSRPQAEDNPLPPNKKDIK